MFKFFKFTAFAEGISFLILLANMLIIKTLNFDLYKTFLRPIGMAHGILFILYIILASLLKADKEWSFKQFSYIILASFIPFGTFYIDAKYLK